MFSLRKRCGSAGNLSAPQIKAKEAPREPQDILVYHPDRSRSYGPGFRLAGLVRKLVRATDAQPPHYEETQRRLEFLLPRLRGREDPVPRQQDQLRGRMVLPQGRHMETRARRHDSLGPARTRRSSDAVRLFHDRRRDLLLPAPGRHLTASDQEE